MKIEADIVVVGAGISGIAASLAAAQEKKNVVLLDENSSPGGNSVHANVGTICGAYYRSFSPNPKPVGNVFCRSLLDTLAHADEKARPYAYAEGLYIIPYEWTILQQVYEKLLIQAGIKVMMNTTLDSVRTTSRKINEVYVSHADEKSCINTNSVVDCSGHAIVSQLTGIETIKEDTYQAAAQIFRVRNIDSKDEFSLDMAIKRAVLKNLNAMNWPMIYGRVSVVPGSLDKSKVDIKLTLPNVITDTILTNREVFDDVPKHISEILSVLKSQLDSFREASLEMIFPQPGIRTLQRSRGKYILNEQDIVQCKKSPRSIATGTWPIEEWENNGKLRMTYFEPDNGYSIPADSLISDQLQNLFFAGKNISATSRAIASARVMGTGLQTGYAAGKLACAKSMQEQSDVIKSLHRELNES